MRLPTAVTVIFFFIACSRPGNDAKRTLARDLAGTVSSFDEFGHPSPEGPGGISVNISNDTVDQTTQTDGTGAYRFRGLDSGRYIITVAKNGYGTFKRFGISVNTHPDSVDIPQQLTPLSITRLSTTVVTQFSAHGAPGGAIIFNLSITPVPTTNQTPRYYRVFLGKDSMVSSSHYDWLLPAFPIDRSPLGQWVKMSFLDTIPAGSRLWMRIYGDSYLNNMYTDRLLPEPVFPCLNPNAPPAVSFMMQ